MKHIKTLTAVAAAVLLCALPAQANLVLTGGQTSTAIPAGSSALGGGALLVTSLLSQGYANSTLNGSLSTWVYKNDVNNPYGLGAYTFMYTVANAGTALVGRMTVNGWNDSLAVTVANNAGTAAGAAGRGNVGVVAFSWDQSTLGSLIPAPGSSTVLIYSSLAQWAPTTAAIIDGHTGEVATLAVPEPTTMLAGAMLLLPFGASTLRMLRKNRTA